MFALLLRVVPLNGPTDLAAALLQVVCGTIIAVVVLLIIALIFDRPDWLFPPFSFARRPRPAWVEHRPFIPQGKLLVRGFVPRSDSWYPTAHGLVEAVYDELLRSALYPGTIRLDVSHFEEGGLILCLTVPARRRGHPPHYASRRIIAPRESYKVAWPAAANYAAQSLVAEVEREYMGILL